MRGGVMRSGQSRLGELKLQSQYLESLMGLEIDDETFFQALNDPSALTKSQNLNTANMSEDAKSAVVTRLMRLFQEKKDFSEKKKIALFLVRYMHRLNRMGWRDIYGDKDRYLSIIESLLNNRHVHISPLSHDDLDLVLKEGMRVGNDAAYTTYLNLTLSRDINEGFENQDREGQLAAVRYAKLNKDNFLEKIKGVKFFDHALDERRKKNKAYLAVLSQLCKKDYFYSFGQPSQESVDYLAKVLDEGCLTSDEVFQMAIDLDYRKIVLMLGQYHAKKAFDFSESGQPQETKTHIDFAEKYFDHLRNLPMLTDKVKAFTQGENYGKVLKYLGESRVLEADVARQDQTRESKPGLPYILLGANYGHQDCVAMLLDLINRNDSDEDFEKYIDQYMARLPVSKSMSILKEFCQYKESVLSEARRQIVAKKLAVQQQGIASLEALPSSLQYEKIIEGGIALKLQHKNDVLEVHSGGSSVYMVATKVNKDLDPEYSDRPQNDEYKLYVAFDPYKVENYINCWRALLNDILGEDNVYGVKMMNPKDAELDYNFLTKEQRVLKESAQPGKMAVIYFKKYDTLKENRGEGYTREQFYLENLALIEKFERALKAAGVTNDDATVVPDHSLPAQIKREGAPLVFISGCETDANGKYVPSKDRPKNTLASNPYTNKAILSKFYREESVASESSDPVESALSRRSSAEDHSFQDALDLDQVLTADPAGAALDHQPSPAHSAESTDDSLKLEGAPQRQDGAASSEETDQAKLSPALSAENTTSSNEDSPSASLISKAKKPSFFSRALNYYKTNPWKAGLLTAGAVLSVGLVAVLSVATAGAFAFVAGGIAAAATAMHVTVLGASIGALTVGGISTLGFSSTLGAMLFRTAKKPQLLAPQPQPQQKTGSTRAVFKAIDAGNNSYQPDLSESSVGKPEAGGVVKEAETRSVLFRGDRLRDIHEETDAKAEKRQGHGRKPSIH
jgi:hypothetical protein